MVIIDSDSVRSLVRTLDQFGKAGERAQHQAIADSKRRIKAEASRDIRSQYAVRVAEINSRLRVQGLGRDAFVLKAGLSPIGLINFGSARQTKKGVAVTIDKQRGRELRRSAFIRDIRGNKVFKRSKASQSSSGFDSAGRDRLGRLPIQRQFGPGVGDMLSRPDRIRRLAAFVENQLRRALRSRLNKL